MAHIFGFRSERAVPSALCFVLLTASLGAWHQLGGGGGRKTSIVFPAAAAPAAVVESSVVRTSSTSSMLSPSSRPRSACPACPTAEPCPDPSAVQRTTLDSSSLKPQASSRASLKPRKGTLRRSVHDQAWFGADGDLPAAEKHLPVAECALVTERVRELVAENEKLHLEIVGLKSSRQDVRFNLSHSLKPSATEDEDEVTPLNDQRQSADQLEVEGTATKGGTAGGTTSITPDVAVQRLREFSSRNGGGGAVVDGTKYKGSKAEEEGGEDGHRESSSVQKELLLRAADPPALENRGKTLENPDPPALIRTSETSKTKTKTRAEAEAEAEAAREDSFLGRAATELQLHQLGTPSEQWWGMEHFAPIAHAAAAANAGREPCVVVEIGAHAGTLALLAGKMGCEVYAFEADAAHRRRYELNAALNAHASPGGCGGKVTYTLGAVGQTAGSRVDEVVPPGTRVTLLKVDIDSVDMFAVRGAEGLFLGGAAAAPPGAGAGTEEARGGGVDFVNLEFSPAKHRAATRTPPKQYLEEVHRRGFDIFLLDCYFDENKTLPAAGLRQRCLANVHEDYDPGGAAGRGFVEVSESRLLLRCVMEGLGCDLHDAASLVAGQLVPPSDFAAFAAAVTEVDVLCVRRNVKKIFVSSAAKSTT